MSPGRDRFAEVIASADVSLAAAADAASDGPGPHVATVEADVSPAPAEATRRQDVLPTGSCGWCPSLLYDVRAKFCGRKCRQAAWRLRERRDVSATPGETGPLRFAYADPPYPGLARKYYADQDSFAGEVDHPALIASLRARHDAGEIAGWALSTAGRSLRELLPLCPENTHVAVWVKDLEVPTATYGPHYRWEAVLVSGGRRLQPGVRDWLQARPARLGGSDLPGRKPIAFWAWLFDLLGMVPGDGFDDLFPGTGTGARAWAHLSVAGGVPSLVDDGRRVVLSRLQETDASPSPRDDGCVSSPAEALHA